MLLKKVTFYHLIPALFAALFTYAFVASKASKEPKIIFNGNEVKKIKYIVHFKPFDLTEQVAFSSALSQSIPVLMGSSELTSNHLKGLAHNFFTENEKKDRFLSIGHAGFQTFGILTVLAANKNLLKNSKITIILSPGWFEEQYANGTSLTSFFEFCPPNYLYQIYKDSSISEGVKVHINQYISKQYDKISRPDATLRAMGKKQGNCLMDVANYPFKILDATEIKLAEETELYLKSQQLIVNVLTRKQKSTYNFYKRIINWDSLMQESKEEFKKISTSNSMAVEDLYYNQWLKNRPKKTLVAVEKENNQEFRDLEILINFLKEVQCQPLFVIMPLNKKAHKDLQVLKPIIDEVKKLLNKDKLKVLDMFTENLETYNEGVLEDVMHPYNLGWYQIDKFILENYHDE